MVCYQRGLPRLVYFRYRTKGDYCEPHSQDDSTPSALTPGETHVFCNFQSGSWLKTRSNFKLGKVYHQGSGLFLHLHLYRGFLSIIKQINTRQATWENHIIINNADVGLKSVEVKIIEHVLYIYLRYFFKAVNQTWKTPFFFAIFSKFIDLCQSRLFWGD